MPDGSGGHWRGQGLGMPAADVRPALLGVLNDSIKHWQGWDTVYSSVGFCV